MIFIACLYTETIGFIVVVEACDHDVMQYDKWERIIACMYSFAAWCDRFLLIKRKQLRFGLTLLQMYLTWLSNLKCLSRMIPKYFTSFTTLVISSLILTWNTSWSGLLCVEKQMDTVFFTLRVRWDNSSYAEMFNNACVRCAPARLGVLVATWRTGSSAYIWQLTLGQQFGRSLMYIVNSNGPSTDPCGTPMLFANMLDFTPLTLTHCCLPSRYDLSHLRASGDSWNCFNLLSRTLWLTVSKAFFKSKNTAPTTE